ncbi:Flp pilus assembly protein CpaB [Stenotrophobium rhamnosiphilum]|uniref:Flp pilus assembly protein CpaB n=1 Tax=Stenotrophobium rhamnosiphilum TaxID=2029166 RepID=A0A2T5MJG7_9GAMM|nr:Flp pilus assembly protein CpaB [Stenotrophobium rhamnosiphilum]PTU32723.1 Flp pilus assembly protein CpaB [Stenotrophobium rhamnosiphilum]
MSSTTLKIVTVVLVLLALILAVVSYRVFHSYAEEAQKATEDAKKQATPQTLAVVALKPLPAYQPIDRDSVGLVPVSVVPPQYFTSLDDVVKHVPLVDIDAGAPVTARYFKEGNVLAKVIPPGFQAISIEVTDIVAVGNFVRPGDIVDVLLYLRSGVASTPGSVAVDQAQSRVLLKDVRVLAYEERIIDRPEGIKDDKSGEPQHRQRTAVLAIPDADTTKVMLGISLGEIRLALHSQNPDVAKTEPTGENGLPLSAKAIAARDASKVPDKAVTAGELSRVRPSPKARNANPSIEVIRGSKAENVGTNL